MPIQRLAVRSRVASDDPKAIWSNNARHTGAPRLARHQRPRARTDARSWLRFNTKIAARRSAENAARRRNRLDQRRILRCAYGRPDGTARLSRLSHAQL